MKTANVLCLLLSVVVLAGCTQLSPLLVPIAWNVVSSSTVSTDINQAEINPLPIDDCAPEDIECVFAEGTIVQLIALCEMPHSIPGGDDDCIGTYEYEAWFLEPQSLVTAHHEGDGEFLVTLFRDDGTTEVLFEATGNYTSETITLVPTGIISMTVQSTGSWYVDVKLDERP